MDASLVQLAAAHQQAVAALQSQGLRLLAGFPSENWQPCVADQPFACYMSLQRRRGEERRGSVRVGLSLPSSDKNSGKKFALHQLFLDFEWSTFGTQLNKSAHKLSRDLLASSQ